MPPWGASGAGSAEVAVHSDRLGAASEGSNAALAFDLGTCPSGHRWIIKHVSVHNEKGVSCQARVYVLHSGGTYDQFVLENLAPDALFVRDGMFAVARAGDVVQVFKNATSGGGNLVVTVCGADLIL